MVTPPGYTWRKAIAALAFDEKQVIESDTIPHPIGGHEGARAFMQMYVKAFPDLHFAIDQMIAAGDYVVTRYTATGTHKGDRAGIPPTGRHGETHGCTLATCFASLE